LNYYPFIRHIKNKDNFSNLRINKKMKILQLNFIFLVLVGLMITISSNIVSAQFGTIHTGGGTECKYSINQLLT